MIYDKSQPEFPNWWDDLDGGREEDEAPPLESVEGAASVSTRSFSFTGPVREEKADRAGERVGELGATAGARRWCGGYSREVVESVWEFGMIVAGNDPEIWRKDEFGNWIHRLTFGRRDSRYGWEIFDPGVGRHHQGVLAMRPMQWESYLRYCEVLA